MKLTTRTVKAEKPPGSGRRHVWDDETPGFGLRIYDSGTKTFVFRYTVRDGRSRRRLMTLGEWGTLTAHEAREKAITYRGQVLDGRDPLAELKAKERDMALEDFAKRYMDRHSKPRKKSWKEDQRRIDKHLTPRLGKLPISEISRSEVADLHGDIGEDAPIEANRVIQLLRAILEKAREWGYMDEGAPNPARHISFNKERSRDRWLRPAEIEALTTEVEKEEDPFFRAFVPLLLLTGLRKGELLATRWSDVDLERGEIFLDDTKSGTDQVRRLSSPAISILRELPRQVGSPWLFPGEDEAHREDFKRPWDRVRAKANLEDVTVHDLRRTCGSYMAQSGVPLQVIQEVLGHSHPSVTRVYARLSAENERDALDTLGTELSDLLGIAPGESGGSPGSPLKEELQELLGSNAADSAEVAARLRTLADQLEESDAQR